MSKRMAAFALGICGLAASAGASQPVEIEASILEIDNQSQRVKLSIESTIRPALGDHVRFWGSVAGEPVWHQGQWSVTDVGSDFVMAGPLSPAHRTESLGRSYRAVVLSANPTGTPGDPPRQGPSVSAEVPRPPVDVPPQTGESARSRIAAGDAALGVSIAEVPPSAVVPRFDGQGAVRIEQVVADSAAAAAGMRVGDLVLLVGADRIGSSEDLFSSLLQRVPGSSVTVDVLRRGERCKLEVVLASRPEGWGASAESNDVRSSPVVTPDVERSSVLLAGRAVITRKKSPFSSSQGLAHVVDKTARVLEVWGVNADGSAGGSLSDLSSARERLRASPSAAALLYLDLEICWTATGFCKDKLRVSCYSPDGRLHWEEMSTNLFANGRWDSLDRVWLQAAKKLRAQLDSQCLASASRGQ